MSIIAPNVFGSPLNFSAESSAMVRRFHTENTTPSDTRDIGVVCNEDNDCPMGNLCIQGQCYVHCDSEGNDCPFWHTCREDLHETKSVCGPYTMSGSKDAMPKKQQSANTGTVTVVEESWSSKWFGWLGF